MSSSKFKVAALAILATLLTSQNPVVADTGYRYWGYFQAASGATTWTAAMTGPSVEVRDGDVEGWVFTASSNDIPAVAPMMDPDFSELCGATSEVAGKIRVGLVVDFGAGEIAPDGDTPNEFYADCIIVPEGSVGADVLSAALEVRVGDSGLICGIAGYPSEECGAEIDMALVTGAAVVEPISATDEAQPNDDGGTSSAPLALLAVLALISGVFAYRSRSRRNG